MGRILQNIKSSLAYAGGAISIYTFVKSIEKDNKNESLERLAKSQVDKEEQILGLATKVEEGNQYTEKIGIKFQDYVESLKPVNFEKVKCSDIATKLQEGSGDITILKSDLKYHQDEMSRAILNSDSKLEEVNDIITKAIESASKSKF
jgi:hypothetical protein